MTRTEPAFYLYLLAGVVVVAGGLWFVAFTEPGGWVLLGAVVVAVLASAAPLFYFGWVAMRRGVARLLRARSSPTDSL